MKNFLKMTLATIVGLFIFGFVSIFLFAAVIGAIASAGDSQPVMPREAVLQINFSTMTLAEQTKEADPFASLSSGSETVTPVGIYNAIQAVNAAASDPAVKFIYMKPDGVTAGISQIEEFRTALKNFRNSGKAIVSYIENPTNAGYYLASVSDKIYMTSYEGGMSMLSGLSSQMIFLKDILDRLGVNVQLIRHGKYKSAGEMYIRNSSSPENYEQNEVMIKSVWNSWAEEIAEAREISVADLNAMLNNLELNFPKDFLEKGLVDELLTREGLQQQLCDLFNAEKYEDVKGIQLPDYAKLKSVVNFKATKKVAVVYAEGNIVDGNAKQQVAGDRFAGIISDIRKDSTVKAVVLRVNSPGGSVLASEKIKAELDLIKQAGVPVIASYGDYAASGGYWISANCDKIYSNATTLTGSIGVFSMIPDISRTLKDKIHVNITPVNSNKHADMYGMMRPHDKAELDYMQASVENIYDKFTTLVAEGREMAVADVDAIAQGRVWTGADALEIGLVDEIGTIEDAIRFAAFSIDGVESMDDVQIAEYPKPLSTFDMLLESFGGDKSAFAGTPLESVESAFKDWSASESGKVYAQMPYVLHIR